MKYAQSECNLYSMKYAQRGNTYWVYVHKDEPVFQRLYRTAVDDVPNQNELYAIMSNSAGYCFRTEIVLNQWHLM